MNLIDLKLVAAIEVPPDFLVRVKVLRHLATTWYKELELTDWDVAYHLAILEAYGVSIGALSVTYQVGKHLEQLYTFAEALRSGTPLKGI